MPCPVCGQQHNGAPVQLITGVTVCNYSEQWRVECEARAIIRMTTMDKRREYLANVSRKRGEAAADELKLLIKQLWIK